MVNDSRTMLLADGRRLGFAEYGDAAGYPVLAFHGSFSSRLDIDYADQVAGELGVRIIGVDRPGMGLSDNQPRRTLLDWPNDVAQLCDRLEIDDFGLFGWSAGGPYALACAAQLPERVSAVALLGSAAPYETISGLRGLNRTDQLLVVLSRWASPAVSLVTRRLISNATTDQIVSTMTEGLPDVDVDYVRSLDPERAAGYLREGVRGGTRGVVEDYRVLGGRWGFLLSGIETPVDVWIGTEDDLGPDDEQEKLTEQIPGAVLHIVEGEGHMSLGPHQIEPILRLLLVRAGVPSVIDG